MFQNVFGQLYAVLLKAVVVSSKKAVVVVGVAAAAAAATRAGGGPHCDRFHRCGRRRVLLVFASMRASHSAGLQTTPPACLAEENLPED